MTHSTYHSEEGRVRSYSVMRLSVRSLAFATGIALTAGHISEKKSYEGA